VEHNRKIRGSAGEIADTLARRGLLRGWASEPRPPNHHRRLRGPPLVWCRTGPANPSHDRGVRPILLADAHGGSRWRGAIVGRLARSRAREWRFTWNATEEIREEAGRSRTRLHAVAAARNGYRSRARRNTADACGDRPWYVPDKPLPILVTVAASDPHPARGRHSASRWRRAIVGRLAGSSPPRGGVSRGTRQKRSEASAGSWIGPAWRLREQLDQRSAGRRVSNAPKT
jgi:hypothetical protein